MINSKKLLLPVILSSSFLTGCASTMPYGGAFTDITLPVSATANASGTKKGIAMCKSILALVATGDCSIEAAKKAGGISEVTHVDWKTHNILGIIGNYELIVYGN